MACRPRTNLIHFANNCPKRLIAIICKEAELRPLVQEIPVGVDCIGLRELHLWGNQIMRGWEVGQKPCSMQHWPSLPNEFQLIHNPQRLPHYL